MVPALEIHERDPAGAWRVPLLQLRERALEELAGEARRLLELAEVERLLRREEQSFQHPPPALGGGEAARLREQRTLRLHGLVQLLLVGRPRSGFRLRELLRDGLVNLGIQARLLRGRSGTGAPPCGRDRFRRADRPGGCGPASASPSRGARGRWERRGADRRRSSRRTSW